MSLTLSESEIVALTGYQYPTRQLEVLRARGFYRAVMGRTGVVLTRAHYEAVESGQDAAPVKIKGINLSHLKAA